LQIGKRTFNETIAFLEVQQQVMPKGCFDKTLGLPRITRPYLARVKADIETSRIAQETNSLMIVGANAREYDEVLLTTLESIDGSNLNLLVVLLLEGTSVLHGADHIASLTFVRGNDSNVLRLNASLEETG